MSGIPNATRKTVRRDATRREILDAAWAMAADQGLGGISLRELGARVGMRAQSLYSYFPSKVAIYDAMFGDAAASFHDLMSAPSAAWPGQTRAVLVEFAHRFFSFAMADVPRYQILFQRPIPGFEPSAEAFAPAVGAYELMRQRMRDGGIEDQGALDLWTALLDGLTDQQLSNDPQGERWARLVEPAVDMWWSYVTRVEAP